KYMLYAQSNALSDQLHFYGLIFSDDSLFKNDFYHGRRGLRLVLENWLPVTRWNAMKRYYNAMPFPATEHDFPAHWRGGLSEVYYVKRPTLVLWGMKDPFFGPELLDGLNEMVQHVEIVKYPDATHWVNHEAPDLDQQIERFLQKYPANGTE
ncbi:MAG TPA: alpha/beta hydrolase, partial [Pseudomonadales bacterium]|nr:alpha/beta hydrolase [Pseudomonadales bacterium]